MHYKSLVCYFDGTVTVESKVKEEVSEQVSTDLAEGNARVRNNSRLSSFQTGSLAKEAVRELSHLMTWKLKLLQVFEMPR